MGKNEEPARSRTATADRKPGILVPLGRGGCQNVTELIENGRTDAAALSENDLESVAALPPASGAAQDPALTVIVRDHAGEVPDSGYITWYDTTDHENRGELDFDVDGVATADLEPGDYVLTHAVWNLGPGDQFTEFVFGISHVTVGDDNTELVLDGANIVAAKTDGGPSVGAGVFGPRMTATDTTGTEVEQTTIRAYGLS